MSGTGITVTSTTMSADDMAASLARLAPTDDTPSVVSEVSEPASDAPPAEESTKVDTEPEPVRRVSRAQQRVNDALREKKLAELELAKERESRTETQRRLDALEAELQAARKVSTPPEREVAPTTPIDEDPEPKEDAFEDWTTYQDARTAWRTRQEYRRMDAERAEREQVARQQQEREAALRQQAQAYTERAQVAKAEYPDFEEVVNRDIKLDHVMGHIMLASDVGPDLAYHFGKHPEDAERIRQLPPALMITEMHRLEGRYLAAREMRPASRPAPTRLPSAPPPPPSAPGGATATFPTARSAKSYAEFEAARLRELDGRRR